MTLTLSQSLFSSAEVDRGSRRLLKYLAATRAERKDEPCTLDLGCGVGVLGVALALDGARVLFRDRDALALAFTRENCRLAGVHALGVEGALGFDGLGERRFDLIVSNLPAKAGEPVHRALMRDAARHLAPDGAIALVVVTPIQNRVRAAMESAGLRTHVAETDSGHTVLQGAVEGPIPSNDGDPFLPYRRVASRFEHAGFSYALETCYGLPEFDNPSHDTVLALRALAETAPTVLRRGRTLIWNPGQGHVPAWLASRARAADADAADPDLVLGGRDLLALETARRNAQGFVREAVHTWDPQDAGCGYTRVVFFADDDPRAHWETRLREVTPRLLAPEGSLVLASSSTFVERYLRQAGGLRARWTHKTAGRRCVVMSAP